MVVVNFKNVGNQIVDAGTYEVTLTKAMERKTRNGDDMIMLQMTINDESAGDMDGRTLFRNFVIKSAQDADNGPVLYFLQDALLKFGADEDEVTGEDDINVLQVAAELYGNKALAEVTVVPDNQKPDTMRNQVKLMYLDE